MVDPKQEEILQGLDDLMIQSMIFYERHRDDEGYDEVHIKMVPRYKTSGLSGDEWRVSAVLEMKRKGEVIFSRGFHSIEVAIAALPWFFRVAGELGGEDYDDKAYDRTRNKCAQVGCSNEAVSEYRIKKMYSREGYSEVPSYEKRIKFCEKHLRRGDCGLQDADDNYEVVSGPGPDKANWQGADIRESAQVIVNVEKPEDIGLAVQQVMKDKAWEKDRQ